MGLGTRTVLEDFPLYRTLWRLTAQMAVISQEQITRVGRAFLQGQLWMKGQGVLHSETVDVALASESYRYFWRPKNVHTLLLMPREAATSPSELGLRVKSDWVKLDDCRSPNAFVRSPYCLGYGEPEIVPGLTDGPSERNPAYWNVLADLVQRPYSTEVDLVTRLECKVKILKELVRLGIWITHPSLHAGQCDRTLLQAWWNGPGQACYEDSGQPLIVAYGRGLYDDLSACGVPVADYLYHPQGVHSIEQVEHQKRIAERVLKYSI